MGFHPDALKRFSRERGATKVLHDQIHTEAIWSFNQVNTIIDSINLL